MPGGSRLSPVYWNIFLRGLGVSLVTIFSAVFIFTVGEKRYGVVGGLQFVGLYLIGERLLMFVLSIYVTRVVERVGFGVGMMIGSVLAVVNLMVPVVFGESFWVLPLMALTVAPATLFYWTPRQAIMSIEGEEGKFGREVGWSVVLEMVGSIVAPIVGGLVVYRFGFGVLFVCGAVLVLFSALPILRFNRKVPRDGVSWKGFANWLRHEHSRHLVVSFGGMGMADIVNTFFWPIYIFMTVSRFEIFGGLIGLTTFVSLLLVYFSGKLFDVKRMDKGQKLNDCMLFLRIGVLLAIIRMLRVGAVSVVSVFAVDVLLKVVNPFHKVSYDSYLLMGGKRHNTLAYYTYREMVYSMGIVLAALVMVLLSGTAIEWWVIFGISGLGVALGLAIVREGRLKPVGG